MPESQPKQPKKPGPKPGGPRIGGKPKGYIFPQTIEKQQAKEIARQRITERLLPIVDAEIDSAIGIRHFMLRNPEDGTFKRLTDPAEIDAALAHPDAKEGSSYWIYTKDPQTPAAIDLLNRATGKPVEEQNVTLTVNQPLADRIQRVRKRLGV